MFSQDYYNIKSFPYIPAIVAWRDKKIHSSVHFLSLGFWYVCMSHQSFQLFCVIYICCLKLIMGLGSLKSPVVISYFFWLQHWALSNFETCGLTLAQFEPWALTTYTHALDNLSMFSVLCHFIWLLKFCDQCHSKSLHFLYVEWTFYVCV